MEAPDDEQAMVKAGASGHAFACELWLEGRLVGRIVTPQVQG
jgi:hypothetical protein